MLRVCLLLLCLSECFSLECHTDINDPSRSDEPEDVADWIEQVFALEDECAEQKHTKCAIRKVGDVTYQSCSYQTLCEKVPDGECYKGLCCCATDNCNTREMFNQGILAMENFESKPLACHLNVNDPDLTLKEEIDKYFGYKELCEIEMHEFCAVKVKGNAVFQRCGFGNTCAQGIQECVNDICCCGGAYCNTKEFYENTMQGQGARRHFMAQEEEHEEEDD